MRDNTVHVRRGKKHPSRMEMIVLAALAALMVSGGTLLLLAALLGQDITDWNHRAAITAGLSLAGVVWGWLIRANRYTYPWDKYDTVFRIEVDAFLIVFYNETDYIVQENQKKIFCCFGEKGN